MGKAVSDEIEDLVEDLLAGDRGRLGATVERREDGMLQGTDSWTCGRSIPWAVPRPPWSAAIDCEERDLTFGRRHLDCNRHRFLLLRTEPRGECGRATLARKY